MIFTLPLSAEKRVLQMLQEAVGAAGRHPPRRAHSNKLRFRPRAYSYIGTVPMLDVFDKPITDWDVVMKWLFDKIVGALAAARCCRR